jgi:hypothetical protein
MDETGRSSHTFFLQVLDDRRRIDTCETHVSAAVTPDALRLLERFREAAVLVVVTILEPRITARTEVVPAGDSRKVDEVAGM